MKYTREHLDNLIQVRNFMMPEMVGMVSQNCSKSEKKRLISVIDRLYEARQRNSFYSPEENELFRVVAECTHNPLILSMCEGISDEIDHCLGNCNNLIERSRLPDTNSLILLRVFLQEGDRDGCISSARILYN